MISSNIAANVNFSLMNDLARIAPDVAIANLGKNAKNIVAFFIIDSFLDAQRARLMAQSSYSSVNGLTAKPNHALANQLASTLIAIA